MLFTGGNSIIIYLPRPLDGAPSLFRISLMMMNQVALSIDASAELPITSVLAIFVPFTTPQTL